MIANAPDRRPFWQELLMLAVPIVVGETCVGIREWVRRSHKARLRAAPVVSGGVTEPSGRADS